MHAHALFILLLIALPAAASELPDYQPRSGISGTLTSIGSDTLANLMTLWAEQFQRYYPGVNPQIQAAGSSTAPPALSEGTASLGPMSRAMKSGELLAFEQRHGYPPTAIAVAIDTLAIYVHRHNPLAGLTLAQLDTIFSITRRCSSAPPISQWQSLNSGPFWQGRPLQRFGRNSVSGTYGFFKQRALCEGDFLAQVNEQPGSASVVQAVASSVDGIGYAGIGYSTSGVRQVPLALEPGGPYVEANAHNAIDGSYPLSRFLYIYINLPPGGSLPPLEREFMRMVLSAQGQQAVKKDGYIPLPATEVARQLNLLEGEK